MNILEVPAKSIGICPGTLLSHFGIIKPQKYYNILLKKLRKNNNSLFFCRFLALIRPHFGPILLSTCWSLSGCPRGPPTSFPDGCPMDVPIRGIRLFMVSINHQLTEHAIHYQRTIRAFVLIFLYFL